MIERVVVWFSAGVTSAVAAKLALAKYGGNLPVHLVSCDTGSEHDDNWRFANEVARWLELPLEVIRNEKFENTFDVYDETGYFKNRHGAKCTTYLKKQPRQGYENLRTDLQVFGYHAEEKARAERFCENNPEVTPWFPLIEAGITKARARQILLEAGIKEPITYAMGFQNANCLRAGCIKGGMGYWNHIREVFPDVFSAMAQKEREIGFSILVEEERDSNDRRVKIPLFLDELEPGRGNYKSEPDIRCGLFCGTEGDEQ